MKTFRNLALALAFLATIALGAIVATPSGAAAKNSHSQQSTNVGQLVSGLINVDVGAVALNIGDITVADLVDVNNVLNQNDVDILNNVLNHSPILSNNSNILTNLLQNANILDANQVVVGVLSGQLVFETLPV